MGAGCQSTLATTPKRILGELSPRPTLIEKISSIERPSTFPNYQSHDICLTTDDTTHETRWVRVNSDEQAYSPKTRSILQRRYTIRPNIRPRRMSTTIDYTALNTVLNTALNQTHTTPHQHEE